MSDSGRWQRVADVFEQALDYSGPERTRWLAERCTGDEPLRREVQEMLNAYEQSGGILDQSVGQVAPKALEKLVDAPEPGVHVAGRFHLIREVGRGGMGVVYLARDPKLNRDVALKFLSAEAARNPIARERFLAEARAAAGLDHPNICGIFDVGETERGDAFFAMPFYRGVTLDRKIADGPLPGDEAIRIAIEIGRGLAAGHGRGVIHRDVKPSNIMLTEAGEVKILDFGVAKSGASRTFTVPGSLVGTLGYMAPEQVQRKEVDHRADIWALGVVLYELIGGRRPFDAESEAGVVHAIVTDDPTPVEDAPAALNAILNRALAKEPSARYSVIEGMVSDLEALRTQSPVVRQGGLPAALTSFIGREEDVRDIPRLLDGARLVTLTGAGGAGKTRLALQVAESLIDRFHGRVYFVPLAPVADPFLVVPVIAQTLGISSAPESLLRDTLAKALAGAPTLLVIDNFEHVVSAASALGDLLAACPALSILATSRVPLRLRGERDYHVAPLEAPPRGDTPSPERALHFPAVRLFVERAHTAEPGFRLTESNIGTISELCRRLDGLPLAIELAAARTRVLPPEAMLHRLEECLDLLKSRERDRPARHQTLRAAISCSHELLQEPESRFFRRMSVFSGAASLEAIERTCAQSDLDDVLEPLESLLDHSLVHSRAGPDGEPRFDMLETIRAFAREQLAQSGEEPRLREAHARHYLDLAERAAPKLTSQDPAGWLNRLEADIENLRTAMSWSCGEMPDIALRLGAALWRFWLSRGYMTEGINLLERALAAPEGARPAPQPSSGRLPRERARCLRGVATLAHISGDYKKATQCFLEALDIWRNLGDRRGEAEVLNGLSWVATELTSLGEAEQLGQQALELNRELGEERGTALALNNLGWVACYRRDHAAAYRYLAESLEIRRRIGDYRGTGYACTNLAWAAGELGDLGRASELAKEGERVLSEVGDHLLHSWNLNVQSRIRILQGDYDGAIQVLAHARKAGEAARNKPVQAWTFTHLGDVHRLRGDRGAALAAYRDALAQWDNFGGRWGSGVAHYWLGMLAAGEGRVRDARRHLEASLIFRRAAADDLGVEEAEAALRDLANS